MGQIKDILLHSYSFEFEFARNPSFFLLFLIPHLYNQFLQSSQFGFASGATTNTLVTTPPISLFPIHSLNHIVVFSVSVYRFHLGGLSLSILKLTHFMCI